MDGRSNSTSLVTTTPVVPYTYGRKTRREGQKSIPNLTNVVMRIAHELKAVDNDQASFSLSQTTTPLFYLLNGLQQGVTGNTRTGREVKMEGIELTLNLYLNAAAPQDVYRVMVVMDRECRGAQFLTTDLLAYNGSLVEQSISPIDFDNRKRFQILLDEAYPNNATVYNSTVPGYGDHVSVRKWKIKCNSKVHYYGSASAGTVTDIDAGAIFLVLYGNIPAATVSSGNFVSRCLFRDM